TIQTDELHSYEEGVQVLGQSLLLDYASPKQLERAMETAAATERITGINPAGHRHIRSAYFSGSTIATENVWGWSKPSSYLLLHPSMALVEFNGSPRVRKWLLELADGLLAHRKADANGVSSVSTTIEFATDKDLPVAGVGASGDRALTLLWAAYRWTGDRKYLQPFLDAGPRGLGQIGANALDLMGVRDTWSLAIQGAAALTGDNASRHFAWQVTGDTKLLEDLYGDQSKAALLREYINTKGSLWIDRVNVPDAELQRARLGGVAIIRNSIYPGHVVSWDFVEPGADERVAILVPLATPDHVRITAYNLDTKPVKATMTAWDVAPGTWSVTIGSGPSQTMAIERTTSVAFTFEPRVATAIELRLVSKGVPYWSRPDLGIAEGDVRVSGRTVRVKVHSLGSVDAPASTVIVRDAGGRVIASAKVPALKAPIDLTSKTAEVVLSLPAKAVLQGGAVSVEMRGNVPEITLRNNIVRIAAQAASAPPPAAPAGAGQPVPTAAGTPAQPRPPAPPPLLGHVTRAQLKEYASWQPLFAQPYVPDAAAIARIKARASDVTVVLIMATWCPDSKRELPRFFAIMDAAGIRESSVTMVGVDRGKKDTEGLTERFGITRVPTFVFLRNGAEVGRVVERTPTGSTLEAEVAWVLAGGQP
ncbi:MAG: thioredoxin family protein, partial [Acidobacteria bacterium]|nr:thioredoxin family protein [Acidobacteriota bacterium]